MLVHAITDTTKRVKANIDFPVDIRCDVCRCGCLPGSQCSLLLSGGKVKQILRSQLKKAKPP